MLLHCNLRNTTCIKHSDGFMGGEIEVYFTYMVYTETNSNTTNLSQGFSLGCPIDNGYSMDEDKFKYKEMFDPKFSLDLPELNAGEKKKIVVEIYCWEADNSSEDIKKLFTNEAAKKLFEIYTNQGEKNTKTWNEFIDWIESDNNLITQLVSQGIINTTYVQLAKASIPIVKFAIGMIKNNGDDLISRFKAELQLSHGENGIQYRWIFDDGTEKWLNGEDKIYKDVKFESADGSNELVSNILFQIVKDDPIKISN